jgi:hypothetical protein
VHESHRQAVDLPALLPGVIVRALARGNEIFMIIFPLYENSPPADPRQVYPAWKSIEDRQHQRTPSCLLVAQPDHAHLAGDIASKFDAPDFPALPVAVVEAIRLHDEGWAPVDGLAPDLNVQLIDGSPKNFLNFSPDDFLVCWRRSIERAERVAPIGGFIVSRHFVALAQYRLNVTHDGEQDRENLEDFIVNETFRQHHLLNTLHATEHELEYFLHALQFCDVLSLYLCSGVPENVSFAQVFNGRSVTLQRMGRNYVLNPSPFRAPVRVSVKALPCENGKLDRTPVELWWELR